MTYFSHLYTTNKSDAFIQKKHAIILLIGQYYFFSVSDNIYLVVDI